VTYLGVMILDVDVGLYIGVGFSLLLVIFKSQRAHTSVLGNIPGTNIFENIESCEQVGFFNLIFLSIWIELLRIFNKIGERV
jgi:hypothetical protein